MDCIRSLAREDGHDDIEARYASLCDFVNHNLASMTVANAGSAQSQQARSPGGGAMTVHGTGTLTQYQYPVTGHLGYADAVLVVDETGDLKKGTATVAVQRQYTGSAARIENAQVAVYLTYVTRAGQAQIDRALYAEPARRARRRDPAGLGSRLFQRP